MTTLVYDGDCGFCTSAVRWVARLGLDPGTVTPWQTADLPSLGLTQQQCEEKLQWVADGGRVSSGHEAVARLLLHSALPWRLPGALLLTPPLSWLAARVYTAVAAHRGKLPGGTPACALPPAQRPGAA